MSPLYDSDVLTRHPNLEVRRHPLLVAYLLSLVMHTKNVGTAQAIVQLMYTETRPQGRSWFHRSCAAPSYEQIDTRVTKLVAGLPQINPPGINTESVVQLIAAYPIMEQLAEYAARTPGRPLLGTRTVEHDEAMRLFQRLYRIQILSTYPN